MIANPLQIFCNHQKIGFLFPCICIPVDQIDQFTLHFYKQIIYHIILRNNFSCFCKIKIHICFYTVNQHDHAFFCHCLNMFQFFYIRFACHLDRQFRNICCMITDTFHIRYHFERR